MGQGLLKPDFGYPYDPNDRKREDLQAPSEMLRVLRGGSWGYGPRDVARCAARFRDHPDYRGDRLGFRVVLRSAPVP